MDCFETVYVGTQKGGYGLTITHKKYSIQLIGTTGTHPKDTRDDEPLVLNVPFFVKQIIKISMTCKQII